MTSSRLRGRSQKNTRDLWQRSCGEDRRGGEQLSLRCMSRIMSMSEQLPCGATSVSSGGKPPVPEAWSTEQLLTKCPGVGERESLSPADPGTSRRGHFICRYCGEGSKIRNQGGGKKKHFQSIFLFLTRPRKSTRKHTFIFAG